MSDQADRLRQLVGARRAAATFTALADDEPAADHDRSANRHRRGRLDRCFSPAAKGAWGRRTWS